MQPRTIAVFTKNRTNAAYEGARQGADRVAARLGARAIHYVPDTPDDIAEQIALIGRAVGEHVDAMVFVPVDQVAVGEAVLRANAAGIPIVNLISEIKVGERVCFVGSDDFSLAAEITRHVARHLGPGARILILEGIPASGTTGERQRGILTALAEFPQLVVVASVRGDYQRDIGCATVSGLLAKGVRFDAVIAANDSMALGALDALDAAGLALPRPLVVGVNAVPEAIAAIKAGRMLATADFDAMAMACIATEAALRHLRGESIPARIMLPVQVVDKANCANWDRPYAERNCPAWEDVLPRST